MSVVVCTVLLSSKAALAQRSLWLDATTSSAQPPAGVVNANTSTYMLLGLRGESTSANWDVNGSLDLGNGFTQQAGRWGSADFTASRNYSAHSLAARFNSTLNGLQYTTPFSYGAYSASFWPAFSLNTTPFTLTVTPQATFGVWSASGETGNITVAGSSVALAHSFGTANLQVSAEAQHATNGSLDGNFKGVGADVWASVNRFDVGAGVKSWRTPTGSEWGYDFYASRYIARDVVLNLQLARATTDPVLATPGSFGASFGFSWRIAHHTDRVAPVAGAAQRGAVAANGRRVHFSVVLPAAKSVAVSGSFTDWQPAPMTRNGDEYTLDIVVPAGTHQYGFLVNGETWYLPPTASGVVDDGFGRKNATLVIAK